MVQLKQVEAQAVRVAGKHCTTEARADHGSCCRIGTCVGVAQPPNSMDRLHGLCLDCSLRLLEHDRMPRNKAAYLVPAFSDLLRTHLRG
jgi:hypothetical protein